MARHLPMMAALGASLAMAQDPETGFRQLWNTELLKKRPPAEAPAETKTAAKKSSESLNASATYKRVSPPVATPKTGTVKKDVATTSTKGTAKPAPSATDTVLGVTVWRLRPSTPEEMKDKRLLVLPKGPTGETCPPTGSTTPERVPVTSSLSRCEKVRLAVEVPRQGYLYIVDREVYEDGSTSAPYLIYPNHQTLKAANQVAPGRTLLIPHPDDAINHFVVQPSASGKKMVAEQFSIIVTPKPLSDDMVARDGPLLLSEAQYKEWEEKYYVESESWELNGGDGKPVTPAEMEAGAGSTKLTQNDALPQTLYKINCEPERTFLVKIPVKVKL